MITIEEDFLKLQKEGQKGKIIGADKKEANQQSDEGKKRIN